MDYTLANSILNIILTHKDFYMILLLSNNLFLNYFTCEILFFIFIFFFIEGILLRMEKYIQIL